MTDKLYDLILCDPPWFYNNRKAGGERNNKTKFGGGAEKHYPLMKVQDMLDPEKLFDINKIAKPDCIMFMWATLPLLYDSERRNPNRKPTEVWSKPHDCFTLLDGWGFNYKTVGFSWIKVTESKKPFRGPGYYTSSNVELCLIATRGKRSFEPAEKMISQVVLSKRGAHSQKPDIHKLIDRMYPDLDKIELFARRPYKGWDVWGNEVESVELGAV